VVFNVQHAGFGRREWRFESSRPDQCEVVELAPRLALNQEVGVRTLASQPIPMRFARQLRPGLESYAAARPVSERERMVTDYVCPIAVILATGTVFRFYLREYWLRAQGQASEDHREQLKGVLAVHIGQAAEIANRLRQFLPDVDPSARPRAEESIRNLVSTLDTLTVTLRDPGPPH
jgi:hypothetical protein